MRAAFLFNFTKFVEWPSHVPQAAGGPFVIGVFGDDALMDSVRDIVKNKAVAGHPVVARRVTMKDDLTNLQVLFIAAAEGGRVAEILKLVGPARVLTVSDMNRFSQLGGMIEFRTDEDRVRFDINLDHAELVGLLINSRLLALARIVHTTKSR